MQITKNIGGEISIFHDKLPVATPTVQIVTRLNSGIVDTTNATVSTIDTTITAAVSAGGNQLTVASATGFSEGNKIRLYEPEEHAVIKRVSGTTVYLWDELFYDHASGAAIEGTKISYTVSAADADTTFYDGRAIWTVDGEKIVTICECTLWPLKRWADETDIKAEDSTFYRYLDSNEDVKIGLDTAFDDILTAIGSKGRVYTFTASHEFRRATALKYLSNFFNRDDPEKAERYEDKFNEIFNQLVAALPRDADDDGYAKPSEKMSMGNIPLHFTG